MKENEIDFSVLSPKDFERMIYDLLEKKGFKSINRRDGGADGGRDIEATSLNIDICGDTEEDKWVFDAKKYKKGIPFDKIQPTLQKATTRHQDCVCLAVYPHLTPQCKDQIKGWKETNKPKYKIKIWEKEKIERLLRDHPDVLRKHLPASWSKEVELNRYLKEAVGVLREFTQRIKPLWKVPGNKSYADCLRFVPKDSSKHVIAIDKSTKLTSPEREYVSYLLQSEICIMDLIKMTFNISADKAVAVALIQEIPWAILVHQHEPSGEWRNNIGTLLRHLLDENMDALRDNGLIKMRGDWPPFGSSDYTLLHIVDANIKHKKGKR